MSVLYLKPATTSLVLAALLMGCASVELSSARDTVLFSPVVLRGEAPFCVWEYKITLANSKLPAERLNLLLPEYEKICASTMTRAGDYAGARGGFELGTKGYDGFVVSFKRSPSAPFPERYILALPPRAFNDVGSDIVALEVRVEPNGVSLYRQDSWIKDYKNNPLSPPTNTLLLKAHPSNDVK